MAVHVQTHGSADLAANVGARVVQVAKNVYDVVDWPAQDLAADLGWSIGWLTMTTFALKIVSMGFYAENKARPFKSR
jgi:hypothetical protein